jgi:hypothetical protein
MVASRANGPAILRPFNCTCPGMSLELGNNVVREGLWDSIRLAGGPEVANSKAPFTPNRANSWFLRSKELEAC